ncbi:MAG: hypothetical protein H6607_05665 [Flavobacteriales bacterium]|nr:hypothetical protein [Flavobacteriales bacterium]
MLKKVLSFSILVCLSINLAFAQNIEFSARYNLIKETTRDEFPPSFFVTYDLQSNNRSLAFELYHDFDNHKRNWPGIGDYFIRNREWGFGFRLRNTFVETDRVDFSLLLGTGVKTVYQALITDVPVLKTYITLPKMERNGFYYYLALESRIPIGSRSRLIIAGGFGQNNVTFGYAHILQSNEGF